MKDVDIPTSPTRRLVGLWQMRLAVAADTCTQAGTWTTWRCCVALRRKTLYPRATSASRFNDKLDQRRFSRRITPALIASSSATLKSIALPKNAALASAIVIESATTFGINGSDGQFPNAQ